MAKRKAWNSIKRNKDREKYKQGFFKPSNKEKCLNKTPPEYRSGLELKIMLDLDKNPNVVCWSSEKVIIPYKHPIKTAKSRMPTYARYFADFYVKLKVGEVTKEFVIEVKPARQCKKPTISSRKKASTVIYENDMWAVNQAKWKAAEEWCLSRGYKFLIINEDNIDKILSS